MQVKANSAEAPDRYFLPISYELVERLAFVPRAGDVLAELCVPELAAVLVIMMLPGLHRAGNGMGTLERGLDQAIRAGQQSGRVDFAVAIAECFAPATFAAGVDLLERMGIRLLAPDDIEQADFLDASGGWDYGFRQRHAARIFPYQAVLQTPGGREVPLTAPQARSFQAFIVENDERLDVQGLAGVGKTHMIHTMVEVLGPNRVLVLAQTFEQLKALGARLGGTIVHGKTFGEVAKDLLERDLTKPNRRAGHRGQMRFQRSDAQVAAMLELRPVGPFRPERVALMCRRAVMSFCQMDAECIEVEHFPRILERLRPVDWTVLVEYATLLWEQTIEPTLPGVELPIRGYHRIKHLSLLPDLALSIEDYTHIIVDESHDLSPPMNKFLDRCPQGSYTLGDVCQRLDGRVLRRSDLARKREISQSVRAGREVEAVLNPLIAANPRTLVAPFVGSRELSTRIRYYDAPVVPDRPTTILARSEWGVFEWFQRLGNANACFSLLPGTERSFHDFILDCIELYRNGTPPQNKALFRFTTWDALAERFSDKDPAFRRIESMLAKGYQASDFERSIMQLDRSGNAPIRLGRVEDARNMELDSVMLAPDLLARVKPGDAESAARIFSALYVGASRAKFELIVPGYMRDWIGDQGVTIKRKEQV